MKKVHILFFILFLASSAGIYAQYAQDASSINVEELTDNQIKAIIDEVNARGLTMDQAVKMAQMQGASPMQVDAIKKRIQEADIQKGSSESLYIQKDDQKDVSIKDKYSKKPMIVPTLKEKRIYGFQFFNTEKLSFEPQLNMPTPQNYVIGIDDELIISIGGASQKTYRLKVETTGAINIPDLGPVYVAGMEFSKAKEIIKRRLMTIFRGMGGPSPTIFFDVSIGSIRSINVNVIGEVKAPGTYTLPSTTSAFNALYLSGGPNENGSFRNIQVIRDNKIIKTIDVYDYLINDNTQENIQLREQDIIKIPVYKTRVIAEGAFKRTGYFELTEKETLADMIKYVGGFNEQAFKSRLSIRRIDDKGKRILDIEQSIYDSFIMQNGDSVFASNAINRFENRVIISGAVFMPGYYELSEGLMLSDLIAKAQGVKENYYNRGMIVRLQKDLTPEIVPFSVADVLSRTKDISLQREDSVVIEDIFKMKEKMSVSIFGEIQREGEYKYADNMTLKDLILKAGGFKEAASEMFIEVARRHGYKESEQILDELVKLYQFDIDRELNIEGKGDTFYLEPFDYIYVRKSPSYYTQRTVSISGEVRYPGPYSIGSKKERVSDLIKRAGGLTPNAFIKGAIMKRENKQADKSINVLKSALEDTITTAKVKTQISNSQIELQLQSILKNPGTELDYLLKDGDQITIPEYSQEVRISGEIRNPIGLAYKEGKKLKYYVERNGGFTDKAQKSKIFVIYSDGTTKITRNFLGPMYPAIEPGCQIIIPAKPEKIVVDNSGKWMAVASTLAAIMIAISTLIP